MRRFRLSIEQLEVEKAIAEVAAMDSNEPAAIEIDAVVKAEDLKESEIKQEENSDVDSNTGDETPVDDSEDTESDGSVAEGAADDEDTIEDVSTSLENYILISKRAMESIADLQELKSIAEFAKRSEGGLNANNVQMLNRVMSIQCKVAGLKHVSLAKEDFNSINDKMRYTNIGIKDIVNKIYEIIKAIINGIRYAIIWLLKAIDLYTVKSRENLEEVSNYEKALQASTNEEPKETIIKSNLASSILAGNEADHNKAENVLAVCRNTNRVLSDITKYVKETTPKTIKYVLNFLDELDKQQSSVEEEIALQSSGRIENIYDSKIPYGLVETHEVEGYEKPAEGIKLYKSNSIAKGKFIYAELAVTKQGSNKNVFENKLVLGTDSKYEEKTEVEVMSKAQAQALFHEIRGGIQILEDMTKDMSLIRISLDKLNTKTKTMLNRVNSETDMDNQIILKNKYTMLAKLVTTSNNMNLKVITSTSSYLNSYITALLAYSKMCVKQYI